MKHRPLYLLVAIEKEDFGSSSTKVINFTLLFLNDFVHEEICIFSEFIYSLCSFVRVCFQLDAFVREHV